MLHRSLKEEFKKLDELKRDLRVGNVQCGERHRVVGIFDRINETRVRIEVGGIVPSYLSILLSSAPY